jgi:GntR family histidine utilization transcriptional repressor
MQDARLDTQDTPQPLYQKVKNYIAARIASGDWPPDTKIPSENELVGALGVSRMTAHRALRELSAEGHLVRVQGVGTFVSPRKPHATFLEIKSIADEIRVRGGRHHCEVRHLAVEAASAELAAAIKLTTGSPVFHSILVHYENDVPVQYSDRYVNPAIAPEYLQQDFTAITPSQYLLNVAPLDEIEHIIEALIPEPSIQAILQIDGQEPCLVLHRRTWSQSLVATQSRFIHPGSRYRLGGRFKPPVTTHPPMP